MRALALAAAGGGAHVHFISTVFAVDCRLVVAALKMSDFSKIVVRCSLSEPSNFYPSREEVIALACFGYLEGSTT